MQENETQTKKLWFKRKRYGWGWYPITWQGWLVIVIYIAIVVAAGLTVDESSPANEVAFTFALPVVLATVALIRICYRKGESPKWQWGGEKDDSAAPRE